eukprot:gene17292-20578_t
MEDTADTPRVEERPGSSQKLSQAAVSNMIHESALEGASTFFQLQLNELLAETMVTRNVPIDSVLHALKNYLKGLPKAKIQAGDCEPYLQLLGLEDSQQSLDFEPAKKFTVVGGLLLGTLARLGPTLPVDLAVEIPKKCFNEKDYLDHRFHAKRGIYLAHLARQLEKCPEVESCELENLGDDARKPILLVTPVTETGEDSGVLVRILPCIAPDTFSAARLAPSKGNLRSISRTGAEMSSQHPASPLYNHSVLEDACWEADLHALHPFFKEAPSMREAAVLLQVWANQRGLLDAADGFSSSLLTVMLAHLARANTVTSAMSAAQIFRAALATFAKDT